MQVLSQKHVFGGLELQRQLALEGEQGFDVIDSGVVYDFPDVLVRQNRQVQHHILLIYDPLYVLLLLLHGFQNALVDGLGSRVFQVCQIGDEVLVVPIPPMHFHELLVEKLLIDVLVEFLL